MNGLGKISMKIRFDIVRDLAAWLVLAVGGVLPAVSHASTITYYHNDLLGSPVAATDASGHVIWRESYRPYGERLTNDPASTSNDVWYTSRRQDVDTGLVYMGARYYDPVVGRFVSKDPVGFDEKNVQSFNRYAYANNNPYRYVDPNGKEPGSIYQRGYWVPVPNLSGEPGLENVCVECVALIATRIVPMVEAFSSESSSLALAEKVQSVHEVLDPIAQNMRTTGALRTDLGDLIAGGARDLSSAQRAVAEALDATPVLEPGAHAETTLLNGAERLGASPKELATSRPFCADCRTAIEQSGGTITGPNTAIWE
jgi:RHS repeat-associated protein